MSHEFYENPLIRRYASPEMAGSGATSGSSAPGGGCGSCWPRPKPSWACRSRRRKSPSLRRTSTTSISPPPKLRTQAAARRDGPRPRLRRPMPAGPRHHPPGRHQLLRHRQHRPDPDARWLQMVAGRLAAVIDRLAEVRRKHRDLPCLGFTHLQPAQPTTVGKRACLWATIWRSIWPKSSIASPLKARGVKGTTGTQASFLELFDGDERVTPRLRNSNNWSPKRWASPPVYPVTGQTYSRKVDAQVLDALCRHRPERHKAATDLRILQSAKKSKSRSRPSRSAPRRWPTSATRCAANGFAGWPGS